MARSPHIRTNGYRRIGLAVEAEGHWKTKLLVRMGLSVLWVYFFLHPFYRDLILTQPHELRMPQVIRVGPFQKIDLCHDFRSNPYALLHFLRRHRFAPPRLACL